MPRLRFSHIDSATNLIPLLRSLRNAKRNISLLHESPLANCSIYGLINMNYGRYGSYSCRNCPSAYYDKEGVHFCIDSRRYNVLKSLR